MKPLVLAIAILLVVEALGTQAQAQNYPWCAYYGTGDGNGTNCGFVTREQCLAAVSGIGGYCERNNLYGRDPAARSDGRTRRRGQR